MSPPTPYQIISGRWTWHNDHQVFRFTYVLAGRVRRASAASMVSADLAQAITTNPN